MGFNCDQCIHPLLFFRSTILLQFSFLSICLIGKLIFLYTYLTGDSKLGPYLTLTLFFFNDRKISPAVAIEKNLKEDDLIVCVQGDEPMLEPEMIDAVLKPLIKSKNIPCTVLAMHITEENLWLNKDTVKIIHNEEGKVLYTSRAPVPYSKENFSNELYARRIYGIFAFRWKYLDMFINHQETRLEQIEACDSNRILDMDFDQYIAPYPSRKSFSVDSPEDIALVEKFMTKDKFHGSY